MVQNTDSENEFVVDILKTLRSEKFSPLAWIHFLGSSWKMSSATARANPSLRRSWVHITIGIGMLTLAILALDFLIEGSATTLHLLPGFLFCTMWLQSDLFWHLGLNRHSRTGVLLPVVGVATTLTWLRGLEASYLLGRFLGGISSPSWLILLIFLSGIMTDILDGEIARRTETQSRLGQIADGEADTCLYFAISCMLIQQNLLPLWFGMLILLRFIIPCIAALASYFLFAHPVHFGSTIWGKLGGLALCFYFLSLLIPAQWGFITRFVHLPLIIMCLLLLIIAPLAQITKNMKDTPIQ